MGKVDPLFYRRGEPGNQLWLTDAGLNRCFQVANGIKLEQQEYDTLKKICRSVTGEKIDGASVVFLASKGWIRHVRDKGYVHTAAGLQLIYEADNEADRLLERVRREQEEFNG